jgi:hypothetical protein
MDEVMTISTGFNFSFIQVLSENWKFSQPTFFSLVENLNWKNVKENRKFILMSIMN